MTKNFNKELQFIFQRIHNKSIGFGLNSIQPSLVYLEILKTYFSGGGIDEELKDVLSSVNITKLIDDIVPVVEKEMMYAKKDSGFSGDLFQRSGGITFSEALQDLILEAIECSKLCRESTVRSVHFVIAVLQKPDLDLCIISAYSGLILKKLAYPKKIKGDMKQSQEDVNEFIRKHSPKLSMESEDKKDDPKDNEGPSENPQPFQPAASEGPVSSKKVDPNSKTPYLDQFSYDMTEAAREGKYDPVVGRDSEVAQVLEILGCRKKNNAVLLGDPGCGKTAIVECLAQKIVSGDVPFEMKEKRICSLDLNALVSGTKFRGEYEERLQGIIKEVCTDPNIIMYIDEFHNLVGNGSTSGSGDGANILKPYLARGEFQCIGSTTFDEYRKFIEKDGALKRRFQNINVLEPTISETVEILTNIAPKYSEHHHVTYTPETLKYCVEWAGRYITDRFFPDKAIDVLDLAGSMKRLSCPVDTSAIDLLKERLEQVKMKKRNCIDVQNYEEASICFEQEKKLIEAVELARKDLENNTKVSEWPVIEKEDVTKVIAKISKVPVDKIAESDMEKLKTMKHNLESRVIGQQEAIDEVSMALQRNSLGLRDTAKPIASMLMVGPTGSGKTMICKELAKEFFGSEEALIRFDMAEFGERHEVTKLTGSTASYVGYEDKPLLDEVRKKPYSVVLFDEIEKAAPEIFNIFLNILDEGMITLGNGQKVDFKNTVIIFTGNVGTKELAMRGNGIGFGEVSAAISKKATVMDAVKKTFRPEFINRLSSIIVFNELTRDNLLKICDLELRKLSDRLNDREYILKVTPELKEKIVDSCDLKYGARDLQRKISEFVEKTICTYMIENTVPESFRGIEVGLEADKAKCSFHALTPVKP